MQMRTASVISTGLHVAALLFAVVTFTSRSLEATPVEALPVDMISDKEFSQMTKGVKDAPKPDKPKPLAEKIDTPKPVEQQAPKIDKKEIAPTAEKPPDPKPPEPKKEAKVEPEKPAQEMPKPDPIAEKIKQPDKPKQEAKADQPLPPKKPVEKKQPKFDASKIAALLDKRDPSRLASAASELSSAPSLGTATGQAAQLSQSEIDALRARLMALWNPPIGAQDASAYQITIRIRFKRDGTLEIGPQVLTSGNGVQYNAMRDSAVRAVLVGQPYTMLRPDHYDMWKEIDFTFDTKEMFHDIPVRRPL
jgi:outer membrane biosynthesis protein TonB